MVSKKKLLALRKRPVIWLPRKNEWQQQTYEHMYIIL